MHAMGGVIDVRQFGGLRKLMPVTHVTFLCGAAALAGIPLLSGFWSKDLILESLKKAGDGGGRYAGSYLALLVIAFLTAFLTAFYTFRAYCLTFWGELRVPPEAGHHAHESPSVMTVPLIVLAVGALLIGAVVEPFTHWFSGFLGKTPSIALAAAITGIGETAHHFNWSIAIASAFLALAGVVFACALYRRGTETVPASLEPIHTLSRNKLYVEDLYEAAVVRPAGTLAFLAKAFDGFLDGLARFASALPRFLGTLARPIQNGLVQFYALSMALGLVVLLSFVVFRVTR
jgi:NADH:ubiquinone oxidoreductase subunit 5 (subunit L)/multisubunit Na+/H+ antiporter MnhA subunit